jgi:hypothetical protein
MEVPMRTLMALSVALFTLSCAAPADDVVGPQYSTLAEANDPPTPEVVTQCGYMWCTFDGVLVDNDPDGTIVRCEYVIGGQAYPYCNLYYEWSTEGTKTIQFSVWDDDGASDTITFDIIARLSPISVSTQYTKVKKENRNTVTWSGTPVEEVELVRTGGDPDRYENPMRIVLPNTGEWVDSFEGKCVGFVYTIYEVGGSEYSYPPHRSNCVEEGSKKGGRGRK